MNEVNTELQPGVKTKGISAKHVVAIVIAALIYGAVIFITRFLPTKIGTVQLFYPAAIIAPLFGIWFGFWGCLGLVLGNILSMVVVGMNPALFPLSLLAQFAMGAVPGIAYRKVGFEKRENVVRFVTFVVIGEVVGTALVACNLLWIQALPAEVVRNLWLWMQISNTLMAAVFSPLLFRWLSSYINKSGVFFRGFWG